MQPPWVAYIIKYIFVIEPFSSLSRALARISSRIPAFLCRAAQCRDAFKAEVSLDVGSGSVIRLSKCAGFEKSLYSSMARKTGGCNPEELFSENIFFAETIDQSLLMGCRQKVRPIFNQNGLSGRLYFPAGSARPRSAKKSPHLYLAKKHGGVRQKRTVLQNIFPSRLRTTTIPAAIS